MTHLYKTDMNSMQTFKAIERNIGGRLRFTLAPAKYEKCSKGQGRQIHRNADWTRLWEGKTASERNIHTFKAFKHSRPQPGLSVCGSLASATKSQYIHTYEQAAKGHQWMGGILPLQAFI